uniref:Kazrin, periplakin interacting protein n=1 Tax=Latimeria chalumnae TaxID=7897 RepID=H3A5X2_LATCH
HHVALCQLSLQAKIFKMMDDNKQLALRIDGAIQSASQEVTNLRSELTATNRRLAELSSTDPSIMENNQHNTQGRKARSFIPDSLKYSSFCLTFNVCKHWELLNYKELVGNFCLCTQASLFSNLCR